jgi:hypothetical protein
MDFVSASSRSDVKRVRAEEVEAWARFVMFVKLGL